MKPTLQVRYPPMRFNKNVCFFVRFCKQNGLYQYIKQNYSNITRLAHSLEYKPIKSYLISLIGDDYTYSTNTVDWLKTTNLQKKWENYAQALIQEEAESKIQSIKKRGKYYSTLSDYYRNDYLNSYFDKSYTIVDVGQLYNLYD